MTQPASTLPSFDELYQQIRALPEGMTGEILEPGILRTMGRPGRPHRKVAKRLVLDLSGNDEDAGGHGRWIEPETESRFPNHRLAVPDLAGWRVERVPQLPPDENPLTVLPDWCCEVLSPSTARIDKHKKLPLYAESGVPWIWLVDPELRLLEVYETMGKRPALALTAAEDEPCTPPPFDSPLELAAWWTRGTPPASQ